MTVTATLNYFDRSCPRGRFDIVEPERNLMPIEGHEVAIHDMRGADLSVAREGFMLVSHKSEHAALPEMLDANLVVQNGQPPVNQAYCDELLPLIARISGARDVIPQATGLIVRFSARSERQSAAGAAGFIHLDVTETSVQRFLDDSVQAVGREIAPYSRFVLYQTWRAISPPPQDNLLTLCERNSVAQADIVYYDAIMGEEGSALESVEARGCRYNPAHRWWYTSAMGPEDLLVFLGYDSAEPDAVQPFHTGFDLPDDPAAKPRASLEARFFAFYD